MVYLHFVQIVHEVIPLFHSSPFDYTYISKITFITCEGSLWITNIPEVYRHPSHTGDSGKYENFCHPEN